MATEKEDYMNDFANKMQSEVEMDRKKHFVQKYGVNQIRITCHAFDYSGFISNDRGVKFNMYPNRSPHIMIYCTFCGKKLGKTS